MLFRSMADAVGMVCWADDSDVRFFTQILFHEDYSKPHKDVYKRQMMGCGTASTEVIGMRDNCVIFTTPERQELRDVYKRQDLYR